MIRALFKSIFKRCSPLLKKPENKPDHLNSWVDSSHTGHSYSFTFDPVQKLLSPSSS